MKKLYAVGLCILLCAGLFGGCGTFTLDGEESVIYIDKKGTVTYLDITSFDRDYYSEEELKSDIEEIVEDYNEEQGTDAVKIEELSIDGQTAKLRTKYKSVADYSNLIGVELFQGKVVNALSEGYGFEQEFRKVNAGEAAETVDRKDVYGESNLMVVVIRANINVKIDGEIRYVSSENVEVTGKDSVSIQDGGNALETDTYTYIIYK